MCSTRVGALLLLHAGLIGVDINHVSAFVAPSPLVRSVKTIDRINPSRPVTKLKYRELDQDDDDTTMLQVQSRAPPGFNMKNAVKRQPLRKMPPNAINGPLIKALLLNQAFILVAASLAFAAAVVTRDGFGALSQLGDILNWTGGGGVGTLDFTLTPERFGFGALAVLPMLAFNNVIEGSDKRAFANVNFSTIVMVLTLFGRRSSIPDEFRPKELKGVPLPTTSWPSVCARSLQLSILTGFTEELVFRGEVPGVISHYYNDSVLVVLLLQALIFGVGHMQPKSSLAENSIVGGLQAVNGLGFGLIYLFSGGDVVPCMVAHAIYDFIVFFKTWSDANDQLEYAERMYQEQLPPNEQKEVRRILSSARVDTQMLNRLKRLFFTFDFNKNRTLDLSEVRKGISYMNLERAGTPPPQKQVDALFRQCIETRSDDAVTTAADKSRLRFPDFLRLYTMSMGQRKLTVA